MQHYANNDVAHVLMSDAIASNNNKSVNHLYRQYNFNPLRVFDVDYPVLMITTLDKMGQVTNSLRSPELCETLRKMLIHWMRIYKNDININKIYYTYSRVMTLAILMNLNLEQDLLQYTQIDLSIINVACYTNDCELLTAIVDIYGDRALNIIKQ